MTTRTLALTWQSSPRARRLSTVAVLALIAAALTGRPGLLVLAAGPLTLLAAATRLARPPTVTVTTALDTARCVEGDTVTLTVHAAAPPAITEVRLAAPPSVTITRAAAAGGESRSWHLIPHEWGTPAIRLHIDGADDWLLFDTSVALPIPAVSVLPRPQRLLSTPTTNTVPGRAGEHPSRQAGSGIEFTGIRPYQAGDLLRDVNWAASSRQRRTMVTERAADLAADLIIAIDVFQDVTGPPQQSSLDVSVRAATALADTAVSHRDRVGVIAVGGLLQWLTPGTGRTHLYRIAELILTTRAAQISVVNPDPRRLPGRLLPPGAHVIVLTPLTDERIMPVLHDLARRRLHSSIIDVLNPARPTPAGRYHRPYRAARHGDDLAERFWQLDRAATHAELIRLGLPVQAWTGDTALQAALDTTARAWQRGRP